MNNTPDQKSNRRDFTRSSLDLPDSGTNKLYREEDLDDRDQDHQVESATTSSDDSLLHSIKTELEDMDIRQFKKEQGEQNVPNFNDRDFYCLVCDIKYDTKELYRTHLKSFHNMAPSIININTRQKYINKDTHCSECDISLTTVNSYRRHMENKHHTELPLRKNKILRHSELKPDIEDPNNYCRSCDRAYKNRKSYCYHLRYAHAMIVQQSKSSRAKNPDPDDPNFYCCVCKFRFSIQSHYHKHLQKFHNIVDGKLPSDPIPNINDPNHYCLACEKSYKNKYSYRQHLQIIHKVLVDPPKSKIKRLVSHDPNLYCSVCDIASSTNTDYVEHLETVHGMVNGKLPSHSTPNINDLNNYCRVCNRVYYDRQTYTKHLKTIVHQMKSGLCKN